MNAPAYTIELAVYQGPFDLLLDLLAKNEVEIWDIPIALITEQYLAHLYALKERDLAIAGEFLVMAATLIRLKSRLLLPQKQLEEEEQEQEDPRRELARQLARYKFFKEVAQELEERREQAALVYPVGQRALSLQIRPVYTRPVGELTAFDLAKIYGALLRELEREAPLHQVRTPLSLQEQLALVRLRLLHRPRLSFAELLEEGFAGEVILTFVAVLELVHLGEVRVTQEAPFGEIMIVS